MAEGLVALGAAITADPDAARRSQCPLLSRGEVPRRRTRREIMEQSKMKIAYVITQRKDRNFWNRVGVAFVNSDGSINVKLEAVPVSGEIQIRDYHPKDELASTSTRSHSRDQIEEEPYAELA
jgi:hypothetical protein